MPTEVSNAGNAYYFCDYFWSNPETYYGLRCRLAGGAWDDWTGAGACTTYANDAVAIAYVTVSVPLCFFTEDPVMN